MKVIFCQNIKHLEVAAKTHRKIPASRQDATCQLFQWVGTDQSTVTICPDVHAPYLEELVRGSSLLTRYGQRDLDKNNRKSRSDIVRGTCSTDSRCPDHVEDGIQFTAGPRPKRSLE